MNAKAQRNIASVHGDASGPKKTSDISSQRVKDLLGASSVALDPADSDLIPQDIIERLAIAARNADASEVVDQVAPARPAGESRASSFARFLQRYRVVAVMGDALAGFAAFAGAMLALDAIGLYRLLAVGLAGLLLWPAAIAATGGYTRRSSAASGSAGLRSVLRAGTSIVVAGAFPAGLTGTTWLLTLVVIGVPVAVAVSVVVRSVQRSWLRRQQLRGVGTRSVLIVGSSAAAQQLYTRISREPDSGLAVAGLCVPGSDIARTALMSHVPILGDLQSAARIAQQIPVDAIAVTADDFTRYNYLRELSWALEGTEIELLVDPGLIEVAGPRMHIRPMLGMPLLEVERPEFGGWKRFLKRSFDVVFSSIGLLTLSPLLLGIGLAVKLQDGGPVFFKQVRVGRAGKTFEMYKFRSMVIDSEARAAMLVAKSEGGLFRLSEDPRVTRLGRFLRDYSFDELPQLWNILNGTMSLVGPRPRLISEVRNMTSDERRRHLVTPGLTGLWQVSGRSDLEGDDAVRLDLRYVENWSLTLDLLILAKTANAVLAKRGAR